MTAAVPPLSLLLGSVPQFTIWSNKKTFICTTRQTNRGWQWAKVSSCTVRTANCLSVFTCLLSYFSSLGFCPFLRWPSTSLGVLAGGALCFRGWRGSWVLYAKQAKIQVVSTFSITETDQENIRNVFFHIHIPVALLTCSLQFHLCQVFGEFTGAGHYCPLPRDVGHCVPAACAIAVDEIWVWRLHVHHLSMTSALITPTRMRSECHTAVGHHKKQIKMQSYFYSLQEKWEDMSLCSFNRKEGPILTALNTDEKSTSIFTIQGQELWMK